MADVLITPEPLFDDEDDRLERELDLERANGHSVYNVPGYRPVRSERRQAPTTVSGRLPADLDGVYLRNGANPQFERTHSLLHAFNGPGMLHAVQLRNGSATYSNTYVRTPRYRFEERASREVFLSFSDLAGGGRVTLARQRRLQAKAARGLMPNFSPLELTPSSTSVQFHAGRIYCLTETGYPFALDAKVIDGQLSIDGNGELETWDGRLNGPFSAHPRFDPQTDDLYNLGVDRMSGSVHYARIERGKLVSGRHVYQQTGDTGRMAFLHDYVLTEHYLIFPDVSLRSDIRRLETTDSVFFFAPDYALRWGVLPRDPRDGDEVRWFSGPDAAMIWHTVNGWEEASAGGGTQIVLFAPAYASYPSFVPIHSPLEPAAKLHKWILDLNTGSVTQHKLLDHGYERPSINVGYVGTRNRFVYLLDEERAGGYMGKGVLKYDLLDEREVGYFDYAEFYGGEALFVPKRDAVDEDDGYLLDLLMADDRAELVVIDAKSMTEAARVHLPDRVPFGVHACWLGEAELAALGE